MTTIINKSMNIPVIHNKAFEWMKKFREAHSDIYFQFRKKDSGEHKMSNGYFFAGQENYASVGLTEETLTRSVHSISVFFNHKGICLIIDKKLPKAKDLLKTLGWNEYKKEIKDEKELDDLVPQVVKAASNLGIILASKVQFEKNFRKSNRNIVKTKCRKWE